MVQQLEIFPNGKELFSNEKTVNVASVPQYSPFRYPGGKTWFVPVFRQWMSQFDPNQVELVEPFAGGGSISLTTAFENLAANIQMAELDEEVAAVWDTIFNEKDGAWLSSQIIDFDLTIENASRIIEAPDKTLREKAFCTILKNRIFHGGILAPGSGMLKTGENGKGITSRWYPATLKKRINNIDTIIDKVEFTHGDAFEVIRATRRKQNCVYFIDPPYTKAGKRLYNHFELDHRRLLSDIAQVDGSFLITYDDADEIVALVESIGLEYRRIPMTTTHHIAKYELVIADNFGWYAG